MTMTPGSGPNPPRTADNGAQPAAGGLSVVGLANVLLRHRWLLLLLPVSIVALAVTPLFLRDRDYTAEAALMPQETDIRGGVAGLAAQFGIDVGSGRGGQSPAFYADFLRSRRLLGAVVDAEYTVAGSSGDSVVTYAALADIRGTSPAARRERAIRSLRDKTDVRHSRESGVIRFSVTTTSPQVSQQMVDRMLMLVNEFNLNTRQSQAAAERRFVEGRLAEMRGELETVENRLQAFLQQNRQFRTPDLQADFERLQNEVSTRRQVVMSLTQSYEQARIDEVRNTPVVTIIEPPALPVFPDGRGVVRRAFVAGVLGLLLALFLAFGREAALRATEARVPEFQRFTALRREALNELLWPVRILSGRKRAPSVAHPDAG